MSKDKQIIKSEITGIDFFKNLKSNIYDFKLNKIFDEVDGNYEIFSYVNDNLHCNVKAYFHYETEEYRLQIKFGLNEFCLTDFLIESASKFAKMLQSDLENLIKSISHPEGIKNEFVEQKKIPSWQYGSKLLDNVEGFELFLSPRRYLEITNGSFVIINYCDFSINSDLAIYYNVFSDDFGSEARINGAPKVVEEFNAADLKELELKLEQHLAKQLQIIRTESLVNS